MKTTAVKRNGLLQLKKPEKVQKFLDKYEENQHFDLEIKTPEETMSDQHRKYYFAGVIRPAAEHFKVDPGSLHNFFKNLFLMELDEINGDAFLAIKRGNEFHNFSSKKMTTFVQNCRMELRNPDNVFQESFDTEDPEDYWRRIESEGVLI